MESWKNTFKKVEYSQNDKVLRRYGAKLLNF